MFLCAYIACYAWWNILAYHLSNIKYGRCLRCSQLKETKKDFGTQPHTILTTLLLLLSHVYLQNFNLQSWEREEFFRTISLKLWQITTS